MGQNDIMHLRADALRTHHLRRLLPKQPKPESNKDETSGKLRLRDDLQNNWTVLIKIQSQQIQRMSEKLSQVKE